MGTPERIWRPVWLYDLASWKNPATALSNQHNDLRTAITRQLRSLAGADTIRITD